MKLLGEDSDGSAQRPRDEPPGQPRLVSRRTQPPAGRVGSIELLGRRPVEARLQGMASAEGFKEVVSPRESLLRLAQHIWRIGVEEESQAGHDPAVHLSVGKLDLGD